MVRNDHFFYLMLKKMNPALLIIDIQNDYFPGGKMELVEMDEVCQKAQKLLTHFRLNNWPIIFIQHLSIKPNASFFIPGTTGAEIHKSLKPLENETVIVKHYPNSFRETILHQFLQSQNLTELVICGAMSHMCIDTTTRAATDLGYSCTLIADACATRELVFNGQKAQAAQVQTAYMAALNGSFAEVTTCDQFLKIR